MSVQPTQPTEGEWLTCNQLVWLLNHLPPHLSDRKLRLFAVACCRYVWDLLPDPRSREAVDVAERFAEGTATLANLDDAYRGAQDFLDERSRRHNHPWAVARSAENDPIEFAAEAAWACAWSPAAQAARGSSRGAVRACAAASVDGSEAADQPRICELLRDIAGNPTRPVGRARLPDTPTVLAVASAIYQAGRFQDLPVLADALEEAGCTDSELLGHCRSHGPHARGCWALDLITGRQ